MSSSKRHASDSFNAGQVVKRARSQTNVKDGSSTAVERRTGGSSGSAQPTIELTGHDGDVWAARFDPQGNFLASASVDKTILLWHTTGACENFCQLRGHKSAVTDLAWAKDSEILYSASADKTLGLWDLETGRRVRRLAGHDGYINTMDITKRGIDMIVSGADDGWINLWDPRSPEPEISVENDSPVTAIALAANGLELYQGGLDNNIKVWDLRAKGVINSLTGHTDSITSLRTSPDSEYLLSHSFDSTVWMWDIKPYAPLNRHVRTFDGATSGMEKNLHKASWDRTGKRIAAGGGDHTVTIWETETGKLISKLPGHRGAVNDVSFSPSDDDLIASCSVDQTVILGKIGT